jgi:polysaccharide export outer membrane protein
VGESIKVAIFMPGEKRLTILPLCALASLAGALAGCAALPSSGPTARQVVKGVRSDQNTIGMRIVSLDAAAVDEINRADVAADAHAATIESLKGGGSNDIVGPGDELQISLFEVGVTLFGGTRTLTDNYDPSAQAQRFPPVTVDRNGVVKLPYAGALDVGGKTPPEIEAMIAESYRGKSQSPQVLVSVSKNLSQTVFVTGDVRKPGRIELSLQGERLLDAVAIAGGAVTQTQDMVVRFSRDGQHVEERLDRIQAGAPDDLALIAGDRIELIREPQTFVVLGATNHIAQVPFDQTDLTLAEAVARAGGPNDAAANPKAIFLFRYAPVVQVEQPAKPTIYQLDLMDPKSYFLAQRFAMRNKDVLYISNASINRTTKFVSIINQLFSPFLAARAISGN